MAHSTGMSTFLKYGSEWPQSPYGSRPLAIELECIKRGGTWKNKAGKDCGIGLFDHCMNARKLAWPDRYRHRWTDLMYHNFIENDITILMGSASSQKTSHAVEYAVIRWMSSPDNTLIVLSTTTMEKMDIGVYAELVMLWKDAKIIHEWLPGHLISYKHAIATDNIEEGVRDFRRGIICRPCKIGNRFVGLGTLAGVKQKHLVYVCDELQFMDAGFSGTWPHLFSNGEVKIIGSGNPKHDPEDQLSITAEPKDGWNSMPEPTKTTVWGTKFMGGKCVNLVGTDSPNFDVPDGVKPPYPGLIHRNYAQRIAHDSGPESFEYYRLIKGVMKMQFARDRVISRQLCTEHGALGQVKWRDNNQTHGYALDPSYGGEDRCVGMPFKFGLDVDGAEIFLAMPYRVFPFNLQRTEVSIEDQIVEVLQEELRTYDIPPENVFYDATGKGTIGAAFARKFGFKVPVAIDSGGMPTERPVRADLFHVEHDGTKRLKTCREHYSKFVTEMWFSARYTIEANQMRGLLEDVMTEGCARIYYLVGGGKIEVEPKSDPKKKEDLKRRLGKSPDLFDCMALAVEGARQLGFSIGRLGENVVRKEEDDDFFQTESKAYADAIKSKLLVPQ